MRAAANVRPTIGSGVARDVSSASHSESKPSSSMAVTVSAKAAGSVPPSMPRMVPIRIFMRPGMLTSRRLPLNLSSHFDLARNVT